VVDRFKPLVDGVLGFQGGPKCAPMMMTGKPMKSRPLPPLVAKGGGGAQTNVSLRTGEQLPVKPEESVSSYL
jgi:hypothetical protein